MKSSDAALYLDDDAALGRVVTMLEACGYYVVLPGTEIAKKDQVVSYRRSFKKSGKQRQIHVQVVSAAPGYWVYAHVEPCVTKVFRHFASALLGMHDYAEGAKVLRKDLGLR